MRIFLISALVLCVTLPIFAGGGKDKNPAGAGPFPGKIAIITNTVDQNGEEFRSAEQLTAKYGSKIVHVTWPADFMSEQEQMVLTLAGLAADKDIKALIINQAVPGSNSAVDSFLETRKDVFIVYCSPQENPADVSSRASLVMMPNELAMGEPMVQQARKEGAKVFVHYSFPRHMSQVTLSSRRDRIRQECARFGIQFVDAPAPDPIGDAGAADSRNFILEDVPRMIARYGKDTAFFATNCCMQAPLIRAVVDGGAIFLQPCCPSPFHGFPSALGLESIGLDLTCMIAETRKVLAARNELGRISTWPIPGAMVYTNAGAEYAIRWIKGQVPRAGIDDSILAECANNYIKEVTGENLSVHWSSYEENGKTFNNFKALLIDYLTY